jgi:anti-sigma B factor antagonist
MNVTIFSEPGITRVELEGSIDGKTAPQIREELSAALQQTQKLMIDMSRVNYLSSAGLRLLLLLYREMTAREGKVVLLQVAPEIRTVMSHTGFLSFFTLVDSQQDAIQALAASKVHGIARLAIPH